MVLAGRQKGDSVTSIDVDVKALARASGAGEEDARRIVELMKTFRLGGVLTSPGSTAAVIRVADEYARGLGETSTRKVEPPASWRLFSQQVLDRYRPTQRLMLGLFGLGADGPLAEPDEIAPLLDSYAETQDTQGATMFLEFPAGFRRTVFSGNSRHSAPLYALAENVSAICNAEGFRAPDVVEFLLADQEIVLPWIDVRLAPRAVEGRSAVHITVGSESARPEEVADAYSSALVSFDAVFLKALAADTESGLVPYTRSRVTNRIATMVTFVNAWKRDQGLKAESQMPSGKWPEVAAAFSAAHPEHEPFKPATMTSQYFREMTKRRREARDDNK